MYSAENFAGTGSQIQQSHRYKQLLIAVWYALFHTYVISVFLRSKNMALNLFIFGTAISKPKNFLDFPAKDGQNTLPVKSDPSSDAPCVDNKQSPKLYVEVSESIPQLPLDANNQSSSSPDQSDDSSKQKFFLPTIVVPECWLAEEMSSNAQLKDECRLGTPSISENSGFTLRLHSASPQHLSISEGLCKETTDADVQIKLQSTDATITPCDLVRLINNEESCLLLDCRTFMAFNANHINGALNVGCSDRITRKRLIDGKINVVDVISGQAGKDLYRSLEGNAEIVVYDESSMELCALAETHPLRLLTDCLRKHGRKSRFLLGGLNAFKQSYGCMCSQPDADCCVPLLFSPTSPEVNCDIDTAVASEILPYLLIGNQRDAANRERLIELGVTHILNVTAQLPLHFESDGITCKRLPATDSGSQNLKQYFAEAIKFIDGAHEAKGRVLVHCQAGVSRSPTIVIAYLMARNHQNLCEAFSFVKERRAIVAPNLNFMGQLLEFDQQSVQRSGLCPPSEPVHLLRL
jgi:dual specificity MAP kinase phosphatase